MSCGCTPSIVNDTTAALSRRGADQLHAAAAPPGARWPAPAAPARARQSRSRPSDSTYSSAAPRPTAPEMLGVPASNFARQLVVGAAFDAHRQDHVAAALPGRHRRQQRLAPVEHADAGRAVDLVAGEGIEVAVERLHVDRLVRHRLRAVEQHRHPARVRQPHDLAAPAGWCRARWRRAPPRPGGCAPISSARNASRSSSPLGLTGAARSRAPVAAHSICQGTMLAWCSR